jgi:transcriptional regulator with XRE-family HTH domain
MSVTLIETPGGERLVLIPEAEYRRLLSAAERHAPNTTIVPAEIANRIFAGEHPVRVYREWRAMTARALAKAAGTSAGHLSDIEHGRREPSEDLRSRLAAILGLDPDDLMPARAD